ncbi:MAG: DMT family transporter [Sphingomonas fennica]
MSAGTAAPLSPALRRRMMLAFAIPTVIWGSTWIVIRTQLGIVPPDWSICYRFGIAGLAMLGWAAATRQPLSLPHAATGPVLAVGAMQFFANYWFVYRAEVHVTSGIVAMVFALLVVPNAILGRLFLGQRLSRPFLGGSAVALVGLGFLFAHEWGAAGGAAPGVVTGIALALAAVLVASIGNVLQARPALAKVPLAVMVGWAMLVGAAISAAAAWGTAGPPRFDPSPAYVAGLLYLGLIASALAFPLYYVVIRAIGAARAAYSSVLIPIIAMAISTVWEGYRWSATSVTGAVLVFAGLLFALRARSPAR